MRKIVPDTFRGRAENFINKSRSALNINARSIVEIHDISLLYNESLVTAIIYLIFHNRLTYFRIEKKLWNGRVLH